MSRTNGKDQLEDYSTHVRRKDRQEQDPSFLKDLLENTVSCTIAVERSGYPLNHIAFFAYDAATDEIVFHYSKHGYAGEEITDGKKASVAVYKYGKLYTAPRATDFGCEYQSVIAYGKIRIIQDEDERLRSLDLFFNKFFSSVPKENYAAFTSQEAKPVHVARIKIESWLGKEHRVPEKALAAFDSPLKPTM